MNRLYMWPAWPNDLAIAPNVPFGPVRVGGQNGGRVDALDSDLHSSL